MLKKKGRVPERIAATMFYKYDSCPHWLYFDAYGDLKKKAKLSRFSEMLLEMGTLHEKQVIAGEKFVEVKGRGESAFKTTLELMREGAPRIYHGVLMTDRFIGIPDILEKRTDKSSAFGNYYYVAIDIKSSERISDAHKYQLVCYGELLKEIQGVRPEEGYILNVSGVLLGFPLHEFEQQFHKAAGEVEQAFAGVEPPPHVSSGCKQSPWFKECIALAKKTDDIALLYNVKKKAVLALREARVRTIEDAMKMNVELLAGSSTALTRHLLERIVVQARALIEKRHFIREEIELPRAATEIFFDIEGDPLRQIEYLFGFLVRENGNERYEYQLAEKPEQEGAMWKEFLEWTLRLPDDYVVYHYGTYEKARLTMLEARHGGSPALPRFRDRMIDLNEIVKEAIVFPLYFYGIKDIGGYIGFKRSKKIRGGGESIAFYEDWLGKKDKKKMAAIIEYNKDDVVATRYLKDWLDAEAANGVTA